MSRRAPLFAAVAVILLAIGITAFASARFSRGNAGEISAIDGNRVTIKLPGGQEVTGTVGRSTDVECDDDRHSGPGPGGGDDDDDGRSDAQPSPTATPDATPDASPDPSPSPGGGDRRDDDDDDRDCSRSDLRVGAVVKQADLRLRGGTARWKEIELR